MKSSRLFIVFALLATALSAAGIVHLFALRFRSGELFPAYSSLRGDPLGTKVLYASLEACPGISVERNHTPLTRWSIPRRATVLLFATTLENTEYIPRTLADRFDTFVRSGGRLVLTLRPRNMVSRLAEDWENDTDPFMDTDPDADPEPRDDATDERIVQHQEEQEDTEATEQPEEPGQPTEAPPRNPTLHPSPPEGSPAQKPAEPGNPGPGRSRRTPRRQFAGPRPADDPRLICITDWLGIGIGDSRISNTVQAVLSPDLADSGLPSLLSCRTSLHFTNATPRVSSAEPSDVSSIHSSLHPDAGTWQTVYARDDRPLMIERQLGAGSMLLSALTFFVSNEAMKSERHPALLAWMIGPNRRVIFDESHLGVEESRGVARLARRYGLHGFAVGLLVLAILFVWRNGSSLVPPISSDDDATLPSHTPVTGGRHSEAGLANLLRRSIAPTQILRACLSEYARSHARPSPRTTARLARLQAVAEEGKTASRRPASPAETYNQMCRTLKDKT